jgi:hypothetical protein
LKGGCLTFFLSTFTRLLGRNFHKLKLVTHVGINASAGSIQYAIFGVQHQLVIFPSVDPIHVNFKSGIVNQLDGTRGVFCGFTTHKEEQQETDTLQHGTANADAKRNGHCQSRFVYINVRK